MQDQDLTQKIIGCAMKVRSTLGPGFLESVYRKSMVYELTRAGLKVESEKPIQVYYEGIPVGDFVADMVVEDRIILELKATQSLVQAHEVQVVNYLTATGLEIGLLLNFGSDRLEFKRKTRTYRPRSIQDFKL